MGWSLGYENGREIGYGVDAECDVEGCTAEIDRGLAYRCGGSMNLANDEPGCGAYCCYDHLGFERCEVCDPATSGRGES